MIANNFWLTSQNQFIAIPVISDDHLRAITKRLIIEYCKYRKIESYSFDYLPPGLNEKEIAMWKNMNKYRRTMYYRTDIYTVITEDNILYKNVIDEAIKRGIAENERGLRVNER